MMMDDVRAELAGVLGISPEGVRTHMEQCSRRIHFYPAVRKLTERRHVPQAIVTINPDIFSQMVDPAYSLESRFDVIVTLWEHRTRDKGALCEVARRRLGGDLSPQECLLIDNTLECVRRWEARVGAAYHFRGEEALYRDFDKLLDSEGGSKFT